jgi:hypothetical protein
MNYQIIGSGKVQAPCKTISLCVSETVFSQIVVQFVVQFRQAVLVSMAYSQTEMANPYSTQSK